jgi:alpha-L-fucosidase 2
MKKSASLICIFFLLLATFIFGQQSNQLKLWYNKPAANWNEALPIGNGRLAAMVFGTTDIEQIQLNEETVWAGEPGNNIPEGVADSIRQIRSLLFEAKYKEAQDLSNRTFPRSAPASSNYGMQYQPVGNLLIGFPGHTNTVSYRRDLDVQNAIASVSYTVNGITFKRETFASLSDGVIIVRLTASKPKSITCTLSFNTPHKKSFSTIKNNLLVLHGVTSSLDNKQGKLQFEAQVQAVVEKGKLKYTDTSVLINAADAATIYISIGTNYKSYKDISGDPSAKATKYLKAAVVRDYAMAKAAHIKIYRSYFNRMELDLGKT